MDRARKPWLDLTLRVTESPEVNVEPDGSTEVVFRIPEMDDGGVTLLLPRNVLVALTERAQEILLTTVP